MRRTLAIGAAFALVSTAGAQPVVHVAVDMDASAPGIQQTVRVAPGTTLVRGVAVYIYAAQGTPQMRSIGYIGGIDRGISFGHAHRPGNVGSVASFIDQEGTPVVAGNRIELLSAERCCMIEWFDGPEVQYLEFGMGGAGVIQPFPTPPIFTLDIVLANAQVGDVFSFHLLDVVSANWGGVGTYGSFTTTNGGYLDTGGDVTPDQTRTIAGVDPDGPVPVPPGSFVVDYIDGPVTGGGATIAVVCTADYNGNGVVNTQDFFDFLADFFAVAPGADFNGDGTINSQDFFDFLGAFFTGCG